VAVLPLEREPLLTADYCPGIRVFRGETNQGPGVLRFAADYVKPSGLEGLKVIPTQTCTFLGAWM
jgi:hypothetical protein